MKSCSSSESTDSELSFDMINSLALQLAARTEDVCVPCTRRMQTQRLMTICDTLRDVLQQWPPRSVPSLTAETDCVTRAQRCYKVKVRMQPLTPRASLLALLLVSQARIMIVYLSTRPSHTRGAYSGRHIQSTCLSITVPRAGPSKQRGGASLRTPRLIRIVRRTAVVCLLKCPMYLYYS